MLVLSMPIQMVEAAELVEIVEEDVAKLDTTTFEVPNILNPEIGLYGTSFSETEITVTSSSEGMVVEFYVQMNKIASLVGIKDIKIQKKSFLTWKTVATADGGEDTNCGGLGCRLLYRDAEKGSTYRVICTFYGDTDGYRELEKQSNSFVYN